MRDIVLTTIVMGLLPFCFMVPWVGLLTYSWIGYMNPHRLTFGFAYTMPFAQLTAIATLLGLLVTKHRKPLPRSWPTYLLAASWAFFFLTTLSATRPDAAWTQLEKVSKIILMTFVTMLLFQDAKRLRFLFYVIVFSIGFFGLKGGIWAIATGGGNQVLGPPDSFIAGNTEIGLALVMVLPLMHFLAKTEARPAVRYVLRLMLVFSAIAVLFTYSRGAVLGLAVVLPLMLLKSPARFVVLPLVFVVALYGKSLMPEQWLERMDTIQNYEDDESASGRLEAWHTAYRLALDYPILGGGFRPFSPAVYERYVPGKRLNDSQDAHSIYFQVLAEHGFPGLALYVGLIVATLLGLASASRKTRQDPRRRELHDAAQLVSVSLIGFAVSGSFLSMSYFDLFFHLVAIATVIRTLVDQPLPEPVVEPPKRPARVAPFVGTPVRT